MDNAERQFRSLLHDRGLVLVRTKKHACYRAPDGRTFVTSRSPSDCHAWNQALRSLQRFLGLRPATRARHAASILA